MTTTTGAGVSATTPQQMEGWACSLREAKRDAPAVQRRGGAPAGAPAATDDFPYRADDFGADQAVYNGKWTHNPKTPEAEWQRWAYDLGAARRTAEGRWTETYEGHDPDAPENSDWVVDGKPVYAISDGVVVNAWRNAPQNPRPFSSALDRVPADGSEPALADKTWLHPDMRAGRVHGAGNFLTVREDDGNLVTYAHARPGTIPQRLCPHEGVHLAPGTWQADSALPAAQQVRVKRGERLFLTGNSGHSSAPHLHIERAAAGETYDALQMLFRHGMAIRTDNGVPRDTTWSSFTGQQVPGPAVIRPPYRAGGRYAWHGLSPAAYQDRFVHLTDSGYRPGVVDGYSVGGRPFYNVTFVPAQGAFLARHGMDAAAYQAAFDDAGKKGMALAHVDSSTDGGQARYAAVWAAGQPGGAAVHGLGGTAFQAWFDQQVKAGLSPVCASVVSVGGKRQHTALFRAQDLGSWVLLTAIPADGYQTEYDAQAAAGRRPRTLSAYKHDGTVFYCVSFAAKPDVPRRDAHGLDPKAYQAAFDAAGAAGLHLAAVAGVDGASGNHRYIAAWRR